MKSPKVQDPFIIQSPLFVRRFGLNNCHLWLTVVPALPFSPYQQACSSNIVDSWEQLWKDPKCVEKSETNAKNRRGGRSGVSTETHTGGSVSIGEYRKRLTVEKGRDPTPSELHLYVHTHGHDGKSFLDEEARLVHERYQEILYEQIQTQSDID
ncbi:uncharacterized protein [Nicotiana sylvestris]|uniref:uncharacterized protein isoform X2 n=1 Tax=Nicotiana sylvestris TaxID=4096 RepID=UPI00388C570F